MRASSARPYVPVVAAAPRHTKAAGREAAPGRAANLTAPKHNVTEYLVVDDSTTRDTLRDTRAPGWAERLAAANLPAVKKVDKSEALLARAAVKAKAKARPRPSRQFRRLILTACS